MATMSENPRGREPANDLQAEEPSYRALFEFVPDPIFVVNSDTGMIVDANPAAEALAGRPLSEIRKLHHSQLHPGEEVEKARRTLAEFLRAPAAVRNQRHVGEWTVVRQDGKKIPVEFPPRCGPAPVESL